MPLLPLVKRGQNRCVEFRAMTVALVPSFGASARTSDWNSAVTLVSDCSVSVQVLDGPEQAPLHPVKRVPPPADAVSVTVLLPWTVKSHFVANSPHSRPAPVTVPGPVTAAVRCTSAGGGGAWATKFAYTVASLDNDKVHPPAPLQSVPQPAKPEPLAGAGVSVTVVPEAKSALQVEDSQSIPAGEDVTRPFPWTTTVSRCWPCGGGVAAANVALTSRSASSVRSQPPLPLQAPAQPKKTAPESGTAIRWTCEPETSCALQLPRQSAPAPRTSPLPEVVRRRVAWDGLRSPEPPLLEPQAVTATATKKMPIGPRIASPTYLEEALTCEQQATSLKESSLAGEQPPSCDDRPAGAALSSRGRNLRRTRSCRWRA